jgi:hypothetical protein
MTRCDSFFRCSAALGIEALERKQHSKVVNIRHIGMNPMERCAPQGQRGTASRLTPFCAGFLEACAMWDL